MNGVKMSRETKELRIMSDKQLIKESENLRMAFLMTSPNLINPKMRPEDRGKVRRRIARINTILGERGRRGVVKQEKRLK